MLVLQEGIMADAAPLTDENMDISKLKVPDLKRELKARGLSTSGNKNELMDRLQTSLKSKLDDTGSAESVDDLDDDLLNDDELDHDQLDATESVLTELDEQLDATPTIKPPKRKISESKMSTDSESKPAKKIVLNREPSVPSDSEPKTENGDNLSANGGLKTDDSSNNDKKVIKLSELSVKERLEMRAKKFGAPPTVEAKKMARAERFASTGSSSSTSTPISPGEPASLDALKKRAERFGGSVSKVMSSMEMQERLEQRKARFGVVTSSNGTDSQNEKAKQRLERFKTPIK